MVSLDTVDYLWAFLILFGNIYANGYMGSLHLKVERLAYVMKQTATLCNGYVCAKPSGKQGSSGCRL